jgi:hypothetical protein
VAGTTSPNRSKPLPEQVRLLKHRLPPSHIFFVSTCNSRVQTNSTKLSLKYCELHTRFLTPNREFVVLMRRNLAQSLHDALYTIIHFDSRVFFYNMRHGVFWYPKLYPYVAVKFIIFFSDPYQTRINCSLLISASSMICGCQTYLSTTLRLSRYAKNTLHPVIRCITI